MSNAADRLTPAAPDDFADALAYALRFDGRKGAEGGKGGQSDGLGPVRPLACDRHRICYLPHQC